MTEQNEVTASELAGFLSNLGIEPLAGKAIGDFLLRGYRITPRDRPGSPVTSLVSGGQGSGETPASGDFMTDLVDIIQDNPTSFVRVDAESTAARVVEHFTAAGWRPPQTSTLRVFFPNDVIPAGLWTVNEKGRIGNCDSDSSALDVEVESPELTPEEWQSIVARARAEREGKQS